MDGERYEVIGGALLRVTDVWKHDGLLARQMLAAVELDEDTGRATLVLYGGRGPTLRKRFKDEIEPRRSRGNGRNR